MSKKGKANRERENIEKTKKERKKEREREREREREASLRTMFSKRPMEIERNRAIAHAKPRNRNLMTSIAASSGRSL